MLYRCYTPSPPLAAFVDRIWFCSDAPPHTRERILPSGTLELVVNLREDEIRVYDPSHPGGCRRFSGAVLSGAYSRYFVIDPQVHASIVGVHFRPGCAVPFLGVPAGELADTHLDLETLWGPAALELREQLCEAARPEALFAVLEEMLLARLRRPAEHHPAVPAALAALAPTDEPVRVREVARRIGLSQRQLIQVFTAAVGLAPKRYYRVRRFQRVRELVRSSLSPDWAEIALECGYYDQSHLIHDFQEFSGFTPVELLGRRSEFTPSVDRAQVGIQVELPPSASLAETDALVRWIEEEAAAIPDFLPNHVPHAR
jgi:AraC-like DNA-binding protein